MLEQVLQYTFPYKIHVKEMNRRECVSVSFVGRDDVVWQARSGEFLNVDQVIEAIREYASKLNEQK